MMESDTTNNQNCNSVSYDAGSVSNAEISIVESIDESYFANGVYHVRMKNYSISEQPVLRVYNITGVEVFNSALSYNGNSIEQDVALPALGPCILCGAGAQ
ncbi:MAG: hypothetical protein U5L96_22170 [Owenweeksia sp.]|nr:hypothetical protein [Owenweeksia sp.]